MAKDGIQVRNIKYLPSGRGIAGVLEGMLLINIYAPSGAEKKSDRENFFNKDILPLLPTTRTDILMAGDFNCTMTQEDTTGRTNPSKALEILIKGLDLIDTGNVKTTRQRFTHYTPQGAARLDRIYVSPKLRGQQQGLETTPAAFTDHLAVILRIATEDQIMLNGKGYWRMNISLLHDKVVRQKLAKQWKEWGSHQRFYPNKVTWWVRYVKPMLKKCFQREGAERRRERTLENFYYAAIYDTLEAPMEPVRKAIILKRLKAQITNLHYQEGQKLVTQMEESEMMGGRHYPSTNTYVRGKNRRNGQYHTYRTRMKPYTQRRGTL